MATGVVKWFNAQKGFGFIVPDHAGEDVFVHVSELKKAGIDLLEEGDHLSYEVMPNTKTKKLSAQKLMLVD